MIRPTPCPEYLPLIDAACDGDLAEDDCVRLQRHTASCEPCAREWRELAGVASHLRVTLPAPAPSAALSARVRLISRQSARAASRSSPASAWRWAAAALLLVTSGAVLLLDPSTEQIPDRIGSLPVPSVNDPNQPPSLPPDEAQPPALARRFDTAFSAYCMAATDAEREAAVVALRVRRAEAIPALMALVADSDPSRSEASIHLLGRLGDSNTSRDLLRRLEDPRSSREALRALIQIGDPVARAACVRSLRREELHDEALSGLASLAHPSLVDPLLSAVVAETLTPGQAARILDSLSARERAPLQAALTAGKGARHDAAADVLVAIGDPSVRPHLETALADPSTRDWAARHLARLADPASVPALVEASRNPAVVDQVLQVLRAIGDPGLKSMEDILRSSSRSTRLRAVRLLGSLGNQAATPALIEASRDPELRVEAIDALSRCGDGRAVPALVAAVGDRRMAERAIAALGALGDSAAVPSLIPALGERRQREAALDALRRITGEDFGTSQARWTRWWKERRSSTLYCH